MVNKLLEERYQKFPHPLALKKQDYHRFDKIDILRYGGGGVVSELEKEWSCYTNIKYSLTVNSGTSGLYAAYCALKLSENDEVIVCNYNFFAAATPLVHLGAKIILADCDYFGNICIQSLKKLITKRTKAIQVTHMWGKPADILEIRKLCDINCIYLIEDCSHAHGAKIGGVTVGCHGDVSVWSFGAKKIITGGIGGIVSTNCSILHERLVLFCHYGEVGINSLNDKKLGNIVITGNGINLRIHPYAALMILEQIPYLDKLILEKNLSLNIFEEINSEIEEIEFLTSVKCDDIVASQYASVIRFAEIPNKKKFIDKIISSFEANGMKDFDKPGTTRPLSEFDIFSSCDYEREYLNNSYSYHDSIIKFTSWYGKEHEVYAEKNGELFKNIVKDALYSWRRE